MRKQRFLRGRQSTYIALLLAPRFLIHFLRQIRRTQSKPKNAIMSRPPIHTIRMGFIKASVWKNETKVGVRHAVTVTRLFKNGDIWQESTRYGRDDLLLVCKVVELAHEWIYFQSNEADEKDAR
jgi:endo-1,4-beta-D-glucanase Y